MAFIGCGALLFMLSCTTTFQLPKNKVPLHFCQIKEEVCIKEDYKISYLFDLDSIVYSDLSSEEIDVIDSLLRVEFKNSIFQEEWEKYSGQLFGVIEGEKKMIYGTFFLATDELSSINCDQITIIRGGLSSFNRYSIDIKEKRIRYFLPNKW